MEKISLHCWRRSRLRRQRGYLLLELLFSLLIGGAALLVLLRTLGGILTGVSRIHEELLLENARRQLTTQLERTLSFDTTQVTIRENKLSCVSLRGSKKYLIYWDKQKLLQKTTTNTGSGVNPLSLEEVQVKEWQVQAVDSKRATLSFLLCSKSRSLRVRQQLYFYNAEVIGDE